MEIKPKEILTQLVFKIKGLELNWCSLKMDVVVAQIQIFGYLKGCTGRHGFFDDYA